MFTPFGDRKLALDRGACRPRRRPLFELMLEIWRFCSEAQIRSRSLMSNLPAFYRRWPGRQPGAARGSQGQPGIIMIIIIIIVIILSIIMAVLIYWSHYEVALPVLAPKLRARQHPAAARLRRRPRALPSGCSWSGAAVLRDTGEERARRCKSLLRQSIVTFFPDPPFRIPPLGDGDPLPFGPPLALPPEA